MLKKLDFKNNLVDRKTIVLSIRKNAYLFCDPKAQQFEPFLAELEELRLIYNETEEETKNV